MGATRGLQGFLVFAAVIVLYAVACGSDVYRFGPDLPHGRASSSVSGIQVLMKGWLGPLGGVVGWYANLLFAAALILFLFGKFRISCGFALAAFAIGSTSVLVEDYPFGNLKLHDDVPIDSFGIGLYLWLASFIVLAVGAFGAHVSKMAQTVQPKNGQ